MLPVLLIIAAAPAEPIPIAVVVLAPNGPPGLGSAISEEAQRAAGGRWQLLGADAARTAFQALVPTAAQTGEVVEAAKLIKDMGIRVLVLVRVLGEEGHGAAVAQVQIFGDGERNVRIVSSGSSQGLPEAIAIDIFGRRGRIEDAILPLPGPARRASQAPETRELSSGVARADTHEPAFLGLSLDEDQGGLAVGSVVPSGPASVAGMMAGDRVLAVNGTPVPNRATWAKVISGVEAGAKLRLLGRRGSQSGLVFVIATTARGGQGVASGDRTTSSGGPSIGVDGAGFSARSERLRRLPEPPSFTGSIGLNLSGSFNGGEISSAFGGAGLRWRGLAGHLPGPEGGGLIALHIGLNADFLGGALIGRGGRPLFAFTGTGELGLVLGSFGALDDATLQQDGVAFRIGISAGGTVIPDLGSSPNVGPLIALEFPKYNAGTAHCSSFAINVMVVPGAGGVSVSGGIGWQF